jgi:hypothetical protein
MAGSSRWFVSPANFLQSLFDQRRGFRVVGNGYISGKLFPYGLRSCHKANLKFGWVGGSSSQKSSLKFDEIFYLIRINNCCDFYGEIKDVMSSIEMISIIGAGALGAAYASIFYDMDKNCVSFVADAGRLERLRQEGVIVNGKKYFLPVLPAEDLSPPADLMIVAVKHHHLDEAIREMKSRVGKETIIISVMNGIESEEQIGAVYGMEKVLYAVSVGIDAVREGNQVTYTKQGKIFFGEAKNPILTERVKRVQALFDRAGIIYETHPDMIRMLWWKFMVNVGINRLLLCFGHPIPFFRHHRKHGISWNWPCRRLS